MRRLVRFVAISGICLVAALWGAVWILRGNPAAVAGTPFALLTNVLLAGPSGSVGGVTVGGPFVLVDGNNKVTTERDFRGRWMLIYFGYTYCPDVCPTELQTIASALTKLGPAADSIVPIFISIDPQRDTPQVIAEYVKLFYPRMIGLTGTPQQIADIARHYRVYYAKVVSKDDSAYLMDHSSLVYLVDPQGRFEALYNPQTTADELAAGLRDRISQRG